MKLIGKIYTLRKTNIKPENPGLVQIMFLTIKQGDVQVPAVNLSGSR